MIRDFLRQLWALDARRIAGIVALLAIVFVVFAGAAHAGATAAHADDDWALCFASVTSAAASLTAPVVALHAPDTADATVRVDAVSDVARTSLRLPAPRGPPAAA